jgi:hypothetical protein
MRHSSNRQRVMQLALFHPTRTSPPWEQLPLAIRQQAVRLRARLLREGVAGMDAGKPREESADE